MQPPRDNREQGRRTGTKEEIPVDSLHEILWSETTTSVRQVKLGGLISSFASNAASIMGQRIELLTKEASAARRLIDQNTSVNAGGDHLVDLSSLQANVGYPLSCVS